MFPVMKFDFKIYYKMKGKAKYLIFVGLYLNKKYWDRRFQQVMLDNVDYKKRDDR